MRHAHTTDQELQETLDKFRVMTPIFTVLADENRQLIIGELGRRNQLNVKELDEIIPLSRPAISHHLKILKQAGIVNSNKKGTENYYYLTIKHAVESVRALCDAIEDACNLL